MSMNPRGTSGTPVRVQTNAFRITRLPREDYHHYDVIVQKNVLDRQRGVRGDKVLPVGQRYSEIIEKMQDMHQQRFVRRASYDGLKNLYSPMKLDGATKFAVTIDNDNRPATTFEVELRHVGIIDTSIFARLTSGEGALEAAGQPRPDSTLAVNLLQVLVSQTPQIRNGFSLHAKSFYRGRHEDISRGLVAMSGIFQSVRPVFRNFIINVDTTTAAFYKPGRLIDHAADFFETRDLRELAGKCANAREFKRLQRHLFKVVIVVDKDCGGGRKRSIKDLIVQAGAVEFNRGNVVTTVEEHYMATYRKRLQRPFFFGVKCEGDAVFPAEFCSVIPGQRYKKKLDGTQVTAFLKHSVKNPQPRLETIQSAVTSDVLDYRNSPSMLGAGMQVDTVPMTIDARQLKPPEIEFGQNSRLALRDGDAVWNVMRRTLQRPAQVRFWAVVNFDTGSDIRSGSGRAQGIVVEGVRELIRALCANMKKLGMRGAGEGVLDPNQVIVVSGNQANPLGSLSEARRRAAGMLPGPPIEQFLLVVLPEHALELRKQVKYWSDVIEGYPTQCVRAPKYRTGLNDQYCNNVALKINAKLLGINFLPISPHIINMLTNTMVVGCDVSHPAPHIRDRPSLASVVYSMNSTATQYKVHLDCQAPRQEIIEHLAEMLKSAVDDYGARQKRLPDTMIVYRDGVSEGEYWKVTNTEVGRIKQMIRGAFQDRIRLVFIVVGKRHHIRFFPHPSSQHRDKKGNCLPGLVVDTDIVHSVLPDFYLQSHAGLIGTSRPSHYVVLHNDPGWSVDHIQTLSFHLCFFYATATRSVSIPAPVYYADRACTRAAYQFAQDGDVPDYESSTGESGEFDLKRWCDALRKSKISHTMYFL